MSDLSLLVLAATPPELNEFVQRNPSAFTEVREIRLAVLPGTKFGGHAAMGNKWKDEALGDVIGIVHADTVFEAGALPIFAETAGQSAVAGMVGVTIGPPKAYIWSCQVETPREVSTLDGCSVFLRKDAPIRFDPETFDGFHCAVEDLCLAAWEQGVPVQVPSAKANHLGRRTFASDWQAAYRAYRERLLNKWSHCKFETT